MDTLKQASDGRTKFLAVAILATFICSFFVVMAFRPSVSASPDWWNSSWTRRRPITIVSYTSNGYVENIMGYTVPGASTNAELCEYGTSYVRGSVFTTPAHDEKLDNISVYIYTNYAIGCYIYTAIYKHSDSTLIESSGSYYADYASGFSDWLTFALSGTKTLTANTQYVIVAYATCDDGYLYMAYSSGSTDQGHYEVTTGFPDPASFSHDNNKYSIYCSGKYENISQSSISNPENYAIKIVVPYDSDMRSDYSDLRFVENEASGVLPYWIENYTVDNATVWVRRPENRDNTIYMYYGNSGATTTENGDNTFLFFDDFTGTTLDNTKWTRYGTGTLNIASSIITYSGSTGIANANGDVIETIKTFQYPVALEGVYKYEATGGSADIGFGRYSFPVSTNSALEGLYSTADNTHYFFVENGSNRSYSSYMAAPTGETRARFKRLSSSVDFARGNMAWTATSNIPSTAISLRFGGSYYSENQTFSIAADWFAVRDYEHLSDTYPEPITSVGSEEQVPVSAGWNNIETWTGTVQTTANWHGVDNWTGTLNAQTPTWHSVESWTGTITTTADWHIYGSWTGTIIAENAKYIGYTSIGSSSMSIDSKMAGLYLPYTRKGKADNIMVYLRNSTQELAYAKCAIYNSALNKLVESAEVTINSTSLEWVTFSFENKPTLIYDNYYIEIIGSAGNAGEIYVYFDFSSENVGIENTWDYPAGFPDYMTVAPTRDNKLFSMYCNITDNENATVSPTKPVLYLPTNGTITSDNTPYFEWRKGSYTTSFNFLVDNNADFSSPKENRIITENNYTIASENSLLDNFYYWKVVAINENGSISSDVFYFTIRIIPVLTTENATNVAVNSATLNATIDYGVYENIQARFIYKSMEQCLTEGENENWLYIPDWWNENWDVRRIITISPINPENYQIKVVIPYDSGIGGAGQMRSDYGDLRFLENKTTGMLSYWIESYSSENATVWIKRTENSDNSIYVYYGNPNATSQSDGYYVWDVWDNFENYSIGNLSGQDNWAVQVDNITVESTTVWDGTQAVYLHDNNYDAMTRASKNLDKTFTTARVRFKFNSASQSDGINSVNLINNADSGFLFETGVDNAGNWKYLSDNWHTLTSGLSQYTWYDIEYRVKSLAQADVYINGENKGTMENASSQSNFGYIQISSGNTSSYGSFWIDRLMVGKYSPSSDSVAVVGDKEFNYRTYKVPLDPATTGGWENRTPVVKIAASNSSSADKAAADYICSGENDGDNINTWKSGKGKVFLFAGDYFIGNSAIWMSDFQSFIGAGRDNTIIHGAPNTGDLTVMGASSKSGFLIENLTLQGIGRTAAGELNGFHNMAGYSDNWVVRNVRFTQFTSIDFYIEHLDYPYEGSHNGWLENCLIDNSGNSGVSIQNAYGCYIVGNRIVDCGLGSPKFPSGGGGLDLYGTLIYNNVVANNVIENCGYGFWIGHLGGENNLVRNNLFRNNDTFSRGYPAVFCSKNRTAIIGNDFDQPIAISLNYMGVQTDNCIITNNNFYNTLSAFNDDITENYVSGVGAHNTIENNVAPYLTENNYTSWKTISSENYSENVSSLNISAWYCFKAIGEYAENKNLDGLPKYFTTSGVGCPALISPENNSLVYTTLPTFTWTPGNGSTYSRLVVSQYEGFDGAENTVDVNVNYPSGTYTCLLPLPYDHYWWKVIAVIGSEENSSDVWAFSIPTWSLVENWTGTINAPAWESIETWTGTIYAGTQWHNIETWTGTVNTTAYWSLKDNWIGIVNAQSASWGSTDNWIGTIQTSEITMMWHSIESWTGIVTTSDIPPPPEDTTPPVSSVDTISPYWENSSPNAVTATASDTGGGYVSRVALWYRSSSDNSAWDNWAIFENDNASPWSWSFNFPSGTKYYQFASTARDNGGNEESFGTADAWCAYDNSPPSAPSLLYPDNGSRTTSKEPTFSWNSVTDNGVTYKLQVDTDNSFSSPTINTGWLGETSYTPASNLSDENYYWRVSAKDAASNIGSYSGSYKFEIYTESGGPSGGPPPENVPPSTTPPKLGPEVYIGFWLICVIFGGAMAVNRKIPMSKFYILAGVSFILLLLALQSMGLISI